MHDSSANWKALILNVVLGAAMVFAFAPFGYSLLAPLCLAGLFITISGSAPRQAFINGLAFGYGLYGVGVSWVYVSLSTYGGMPLWMGSIAVFGFAGIMALFIASSCYLAAKLLVKRTQRLLMLPFVWVIFEWMKSWVLTGFPWLDVGYTQTSTWLAGWAPLGGVYLVSLVVALGAVGLVLCASQKRWFGLLCLSVILMSSWWLERMDWSTDSGAPIRVGVVQANVPINSKWLTTSRDRLVSRYISLSSELMADKPVDLVVWPETALPMYLQQTLPDFWNAVSPSGAALLTGLLDSPSLLRSPRSYEETYNAAVLVCDDKTQVYRKRHLVPFGEYMPMRFIFDWVLDYLELPMSDLSSWKGQQALECSSNINVGLSICYEDAFANEYREHVGESTLLVNISEDAWFGDSFAPHQRLQMAQMRSRELARPMVRSANSGPSVIINERGRVVAQTRQFEVQLLNHEVQPKTGDTLYKRLGNWVVWISMLVVMGLSVVSRVRR